MVTSILNIKQAVQQSTQKEPEPEVTLSTTTEAPLPDIVRLMKAIREVSGFKYLSGGAPDADTPDTAFTLGNESINRVYLSIIVNIGGSGLSFGKYMQDIRPVADRNKIYKAVKEDILDHAEGRYTLLDFFSTLTKTNPVRFTIKNNQLAVGGAVQPVKIVHGIFALGSTAPMTWKKDVILTMKEHNGLCNNEIILGKIGEAVDEIDLSLLDKVASKARIKLGPKTALLQSKVQTDNSLYAWLICEARVKPSGDSLKQDYIDFITTHKDNLPW